MDILTQLSVSPWFIALSGIASILALIFYIGDKYADKESRFFKISSFLLTIKIPILIALIIVLISNYGIYLLFGSNGSIKQNISLIVPLDASRDVVMDAERQVLGLTSLLIRKPEYSQKFDFSIIKASMDSATVEQSILNEFKNKGTKYFVITMSKHATQIYKDWDKMFSSVPINDRPIVISTIASSPDVKTIKDHYYRFYIRSNEEGAVLAKKANDSNINKVSFIAVDDAYGEGAVKSFKNVWTRRFEEGIYVSNGDDKASIKKRINEIKERFNDQDAIFVAHYGNGIDNIITSLDELGINKAIIATSTITISTWKKPINDILAKNRLITCIPKVNKDKYTIGEFIRVGRESSDTYKGDVVVDFIYYTFDRLITTIIDMKKDHKSSFNDIWVSANNKIPDDILYGFEEETGDSRIEMEAISNENLIK